jgi:hypothetical protein
MGSFLQNFLTAKPTATKKKVAYFYDSTSDPVYHSDSSATTGSIRISQPNVLQMR